MIELVDPNDARAVRNRDNILALYDLMINKKEVEQAVAKFFAPEYIHRNPLVPDEGPAAAQRWTRRDRRSAASYVRRRIFRMTSQNAVSNLPSGSDDADGRWLQVLPGERFAIRVPSAKTEGRYTAIEATAEPNCGPPLHIHHHAEEHFIILEGTVRFVCEDRAFDAPAGTSVTIPKGARHAFTESDRISHPHAGRVHAGLRPGSMHSGAHRSAGRA